MALHAWEARVCITDPTRIELTNNATMRTYLLVGVYLADAQEIARILSLGQAVEDLYRRKDAKRAPPYGISQGTILKGVPEL